MRPTAHKVLLIAAALLVATWSPAAPAAGPDPLFESHDVLEIRIRGPMATLIGKRPDDEDLPATASWREADGRVVEVDIGLRARGNFRRRRETCPFPPIRLDFKKSEVKDTLFEKQDKLKLVTHCRDRSSRHEQVLLREYVTYRILNQMTDVSYRVRPFLVTYEDSESKRRDLTAYAFAIEHKERMAKRVGLPMVEVERISAEELDPAFTNLMSVFQYLIGNTDYSPIAGAEGETCCHNSALFGGDGTAILPVPYDFDMSGMIDAPHGGHNPRFKLRSARQRLYRGRCSFNAHLPASIEAFADQKEALYALVENEPLLSKSSKKSMRSYLNSFYKVLESPKHVERNLVGACVGAE